MAKGKRIKDELTSDGTAQLTVRYEGKRLYLFKVEYALRGKGVFISKISCEINGSDFDMDKVIQYIGREKIETVVSKAFVSSRLVSLRSEVVVSPQAY